MGLLNSTNKLTGTLRRVWRYAGSPSNGTSGTLAGVAEKGDLLIDSTNAKLYMNTNTQASPTWSENAASGSGASLGVVGDMAANGTSTANAAGVGTTAAAIDHVHKLGTHDHSDDTKGGASIGAVTIASMTLSGDIDMSGGATGTYDFILKDAVADALSIRRGSTDVIVFDTSTPRVTITPVVTITGALTASAGISVTTGGITVSAGGVTVTGTSSITGDLTVTGDVVITGDLTWGGTFTLDELILDSDGVAPAGTLTYIVSDNTGDVTINALTGKEVHVAINGNDEYDFNATAFQIASANNIQFMGNNGILDSNGNEVIMVEAVGSAVNYLNVKNAETANAIVLECLGTADKGFIFQNDQDEELLTLTPVATALYNFNLINAATGGRPTIQTEGAADIGIDFETSESEEMLSLIPVASAVTYITITSATTGVAPSIGTAGENDIGIKFVNAEAEEMLVLASVATAITYIQISSSATATAPIISSQGEDDIAIAFHNNQAEEILTLTPIATGVDYIDIKSGDGSTMPTISTTGDTAAVDLVLAPKGTGAVVLNNGTDPVTLKLMGVQAAYNNEIVDVNGNELIDLQGVASAVCEIGISNAVAGSPAIIKAMGETNSNLMIDTLGTGQITFALGGDEVLKLHDSAAMTFAAAADTAGHAIYIQTEDGGTDGGVASTGKAGGLAHISTGDGSAAVTGDAVGGAGGALSIVTGAGAAGDGTGNGGVGGALAITAGAGGSSGAGAGTGGTGGSITLTAGAGGAAGGGTAGAPGKVTIGAGIFCQKVQTIDMADSALQLTMAPGAPNGTLMTGNILYVDANSTGTENLLLPYEADCTGMMLMIVNTGGETINLQNDAGGALLTIATAEVGFVACNGTTWFGFVGVA